MKQVTLRGLTQQWLTWGKRLLYSCLTFAINRVPLASLTANARGERVLKDSKTGGSTIFICFGFHITVITSN